MNMLQIIPAIDILNQQIVRLNKGDYNQVTNYPIELSEMIQRLNHNGTNLIHIVDLNGTMQHVAKTDIQVQYGGGIRSIDQIKRLIDAGIHRVVVGTKAVTDDVFLEQLSKEVCDKDKCSDRVVIAIDILDEKIKYQGWLESASIHYIDFIQKCTELGYFRFLCTDINKDGLLQGAGIELYQKIKEHFPFIKLIGSGGISSINDIEKVNEEVKLEGFVVGKAIYENKIDLKEIVQWNLFKMATL
jgi:phosphoribosylformimino-5-aminoimidazole carboxamide ribotide isomerase